MAAFPAFEVRIKSACAGMLTMPNARANAKARLVGDFKLNILMGYVNIGGFGEVL
jgi:hypothetical protein